MLTPQLGTEEAAATHAASGAQVTPEMQSLASMIAAGAMPAPDTTSGWQNLVRQFANGGAAPQQSMQLPNEAPASPSQTTQPLTTGNAPGPVVNGAPTGGSSQVDSFLGAIRQHESGGNYTAYNAGGGASGAYQFIDSTWANEAKAAGYDQWANGPASAAPPSVQDAVARYMALNYYNTYGSWKNAAEAWYMPSMAGNAADQNSVPYASAGNTETVGQYGDQIVQGMIAAGAAPNNGGRLGTPVAVGYARSALGTPYKWGGESSSGFDCSGLVQAAYKQAGVDLPRTAQQQYDATTKVSPGALQPGDLVFFGPSTQAISHVGIYIGNGQMIDAPHTGAQVRVESYQWPDFVGATRPTSTGGEALASSVQQASAGGSAPTGANYYAILEQLQAAMNGMAR
jgi:cell wall-associated NlpC family hydrolase